MPAVKPVAQSADKWARRASQATKDYSNGISSPRRSWAAATSAAEEAWQQGIQQAAARGAFASGVQDAGDQKWARKASQVGAQRYAPGVQAAKGDYQSGFAPFAQVIENVTLPPRGAKGSPQNYQRVQAIGEALHSAKVGGTS